MAKQLDNQRLAHKLEGLSESDARAVLSYIQNLEASQSSRQPNVSGDDELISTLSDQRENARARQVFEWENARRQNDSFGDAAGWLKAA